MVWCGGGVSYQATALLIRLNVDSVIQLANIISRAPIFRILELSIGIFDIPSTSSQKATAKKKKS